MANWISVAQTSEITGLKPPTLRAYARSGQSDLLPNVDFCVRTYRHYARQRKRLFFSVRGVERIIMGAYRVFSWNSRPLPVEARRFDNPRRSVDDGQFSPSVPEQESSLVFPERSSPRVRATLARYFVTRAVQEFIKHPCVVPGCRCRIHEILPALEVMLELRNNDMHDKRTKLGREFDAPDEQRLTWLHRGGGAGGWRRNEKR